MLLHRDLPLILDGLRERGLTIAFAESCTGGRLAADLTTIPGSSDVVAGSAVCYQISAKHKVLGLTFVNEDNVVSERTAKAMAFATQKLYGVDIGVATTGLLDGDDPHAYWAMKGPVLEDPIKNQHLGAWRIDFPKDASRDLNREIIVRAVMEGLTIWVTKSEK